MTYSMFFYFPTNACNIPAYMFPFIYQKKLSFVVFFLIFTIICLPQSASLMKIPSHE